MSLIGTYSCAQLGAQLQITEANNANGNAAGNFIIAGQTYPVTIHYHFDNNVGPNTVMWITNSNSYGWQYVGAAGCCSDTSASQGIQLAGGFAGVNSVVGFSGLFTK